jgi:hypothetical protein
MEKGLKARNARAAVGYWGFIGKIHRGRFDEWLNKELEQATYSDLPSLATALADILNKACRHRPLGDGESAGLHVAGYHTWDDGEWRPFFFHVHNGPGQFEIHHVTQPLPLPFGQNLVEVRRRWVAGPRTLFEAHQDFPSKNASLEENISTLKRRPLTRNGDFFYYSILWEALERAFNYLDLIPNLSIPRNDSLGPRRGLLHAALETTVRVYRCSNQSKIVGGKVVSVAIGPDGYLPD